MTFRSTVMRLASACSWGCGLKSVRLVVPPICTARTPPWSKRLSVTAISLLPPFIDRPVPPRPATFVKALPRSSPRWQPTILIAAPLQCSIREATIRNQSHPPV